MTPKRKRVMIVEDDHLLLMVEERLVEKLGYEVAGTATNGEKAISEIQNISPDILLVDINLGGEMTGIELVQQLRKNGIESPVIYLSGEENSSFQNEARLTACSDYLLKPVTAKELKQSLDKASLFKNVSAHNAA